MLLAREAAMKEQGLTLLEMLVVIVLIGVIAGFAVTPMAEYYRNRAVRGAADQFVAAHSLARSTAVRFGRLGELHIQSSSARFWVEVDTSTTAARDTIGPVRDPAPTALAMSSTDSLLCFDARGLPSNRNTSQAIPCGGPAATVIFSLDGYADTVIISALGKVMR